MKLKIFKQNKILDYMSRIFKIKLKKSLFSKQSFNFCLKGKLPKVRSPKIIVIGVIAGMIRIQPGEKDLIYGTFSKSQIDK